MTDTGVRTRPSPFASRDSFPARLRIRTALTLIEMLIAISVASIVLAAALPRINLGRYKVDAAMRILQGTLQQAQRNAIQRQHDVIVSFDTAGARMQMLYDANNNRGADEGEHVTWIPLQEGNRFGAPAVGIRGAPTAVITGSNLSQVNGLPSVTFRRDGATSSDLEVYVRAPGAASEDYRALTVVQSTGKATSFRYSGTSWRKDGG